MKRISIHICLAAALSLLWACEDPGSLDHADSAHMDAASGSLTDDGGSVDDATPEDAAPDSAPHALCGDGIIEGDEVCDDGTNDGSYGGCTEDCVRLGPHCGDGIVNGPEFCDDGINDGSEESCAADCLARGPRCGDGVVSGDEACDDSINDGSYGSCAVDCTGFGPHCGDGIVNGPEICDDGVNNGSEESCAADCLTQGPRCGDGVVSGDEICDDGTNDGAYDGCSEDCAGFGPHCGDGEVNGSELCDDGVNDGRPASCLPDCSAVVPWCGDGVVNGDEICDDGTNDGSYGGCVPGCAALGPHCGDGVVSGDEICDDGANDGSYGGCAPGCTALGPHCGDGLVNGDEVCDDGTNDGSYNGCTPGCAARGPHCGDGAVNGTQSNPEHCDDGVNDGSYGHCLRFCAGPGPFCGDGILNGDQAHPEECDDGTQNGRYGRCAADCQGQGPHCGDGLINGDESCDDGSANGSYGKCAVGCAGPGPRCGDGIVNGPERCDDGQANGSYDQCAADCTGPGPHCGDGVVNGPGEECEDGNENERDDCLNTCRRPDFTVSYGQLENVELESSIALFFSRSIDIDTLTPENIKIKKGNQNIELTFLPGPRSVNLLVARWDPNTTYTIEVGAGVKDIFGNALTPSTRTFRTANVALALFDPLGCINGSIDGNTTTTEPNYTAISAPLEYVLLGANTAPDDVIILDHKRFNTFPEAVPSHGLLHKSALPALRYAQKRGVRARLDNDLRDEVVVGAFALGTGLTLSIIDPTPTRSGQTRGTSFATQTLSHVLGNIHHDMVFDIAVGQFDDDSRQEIFVVTGVRSHMNHNPDATGEITLYVFDDVEENYELIKSQVLKTHGKPITGISIAVGDVDRDNIDEIAIAYNIRDNAPLLNGQLLRAHLYRRNDTTLTEIDLPVSWAGPNMHDQPIQSYNLAQMVKVAIDNVDEDPSQREIIVSNLRGGVGTAYQYQSVYVLHYKPQASPPVTQPERMDVAVTVLNDSFYPAPDRVLSTMSITEGAQKQLLLMDGSIRKYQKHPVTGVPQLLTLFLDPRLALNPDIGAVAVGEVEPRAFDGQGQPLQDHRSDEIVHLKAGALTAYAIDEHKDNEGVITGYSIRRLEGTPTAAASSTPGSPMLVLADMDHDGIYGEFVGHSTKLSDNHIIALVAAPPCLPDMDCESTYAFTEENSNTNSLSVGFSAGATIGFHLLANASTGLVVNGGITVKEIDLDFSVKAIAEATVDFVKEYSTTATYTTKYDHMVVFSTTPYEVYHYKITSHPSPDIPEAQPFTIAIPRIPSIYSQSLTHYNRQSPAEVDKVSGILTSTPGNLASYARIQDFHDGANGWLQDKDIGVFSINANQAFMTAQEERRGAISRGIAHTNSSSTTFTGSFTIEEEATLRGCIATACIGGTVGASQGYAFAYGFSDTVEVSTTIDNVLMTEPTYRILLAPHRVQRTMVDGAVSQDFIVLDYLVEPPADYVPPGSP